MARSDDLGEAHERLASLIGRVVILSNDLVGSTAMLYVSISGHEPGFVGEKFNKWRNDDKQRDKTLNLARRFLDDLPADLAEVERLIEWAKRLAKERDAAVHQPWGINHLTRQIIPYTWIPLHPSLEAEHEAQFERLSADLLLLNNNMGALIRRLIDSRQVDKIRRLYRDTARAVEKEWRAKRLS